jgi:hypothetical protein
MQIFAIGDQGPGIESDNGGCHPLGQASKRRTTDIRQGAIVVWRGWSVFDYQISRQIFRAMKKIAGVDFQNGNGTIFSPSHLMAICDTRNRRCDPKNTPWDDSKELRWDQRVVYVVHGKIWAVAAVGSSDGRFLGRFKVQKWRGQGVR